MQSKRAQVVFILACTITLSILFGSVAHATFEFLWENKNSVQTALTLQSGQSVTCEASVDRIAARNNPPYFVLKDEFRASGQPESRIVVLCRPPANLRRGTVRLTGTVGRLPSNEPCIINPSIEGLFDQRGNPVYCAPIPGPVVIGTWQALSIPTRAIPPSDPSMPNDGVGVSSEVSAYATENISTYDTVASFIATNPSLFEHICLECKPIVGSGSGFIIIGDDNSQATVKAYTKITTKPEDRVVRLTGTVHTEDGNTVIYADNGPSPYFDQQGFVGEVTTASPGSVAYAATLSDSSASEGSTGIESMNFDSQELDDGSWIYLTGQVVTYIGNYYSYALSKFIDVYNIQGLDGTPGIRVWKPTNIPTETGSVVDIMAKVDTKDGQRLLGIYSTDIASAVNINNSNHSLEPKVLIAAAELPNVVPIGLTNRDLGGCSLGKNPGIVKASDPGKAYGPYNIGSYVNIWGKVLDLVFSKVESLRC